MSEAQFTAEQLQKLKSAMSRVSQTQTQTAPAPQTQSAGITMVDAGQSELGEFRSNLAAKTYLRVDEDDMSAWLYLAPPDHGQEYSKRDLLEYLAHNGIVMGYHSSNLSAMIKKKVYSREILVAQGKESVDGTDGYFEYLFTPEEYGVPKIREDGSVDYTNMSALQNVHKGDKVATYHYAIQGVDGYTVYGATLKAKPAKDLPPARGKGIRREENEYYAQTDGKIEVKRGKIDIQNVHEIMGDVTLIIGKVEFFGDIIINGNVEGGVVIRAGRNIEIHGTTGSASLFAGGDIVLSRGIQGGGKISTRGSVYADFIENTTVEAGGVVQSNTILNARIIAKDRVITTGKKGVIIGGYVHGLKGIQAMSAGSDVEVKTILHCGYNEQDYEKLLELRRRENETKEKLAELVDNMTEALREKRMRGSSTSSATETKLAEWNKTKDMYFQELDDIGREREGLEEIMEQSKGACIKIDGNLYRNVMICINAEQMMIEKSTRFMKYSADKGVIEASVL